MTKIEDQAGIYIYDSFEYPEDENIFMTVIFAEIDPIQYWRDRPLLLNKQKPELYDAVSLTPTILVEATGVEVAIETIEEVGIVLEAVDDQKEEVQEVIEEMKEFYIPPPSADFITLEWWSEDNQTIFVGNYYTDYVVVTVGSSMLDRSEFIATSGTELVLLVAANHHQLVRLESVKETPVISTSGNITLMRTLESEELLPGTHSLISFLETEEILSKLAIDIKATPKFDGDAWEGLLKDYGDTYNSTQEHLGHIPEKIPEEMLPENQPLVMEIVEESWKPMGELSEEWLGIPLINMGPKDTNTKDSFIVNVNSKNDWNVSVTNLTTTGLDKDKLIINKQIPPGKRFMIGAYTLKNLFGIILRIEGDPKLYQKEIQTTGSEKPIALSYGIDSDGLKSLTGSIKDVLFWDQLSNFNHNVPSPEPKYPSDGWTYDFRKSDSQSTGIGGTIDGNTIRTIYDYGPTTRAGFGPNTTDAKYLQLSPSFENVVTGFPGVHPWFFIHQSYLDNFFCRSHLKQSSFTIIWHQWLFQYPVGTHAWVSDSVYSNFLSYDYDNFEVIFEFNGRLIRERLTIPEELWAQFSLRYDVDTGDLTFAFIDFNFFILEEIVINIGNDLEFELISLFARFDKQEKEYQQSHNGLFGMVMIHEELKTNTDIIDLSVEISKYLTQYSPTLKEEEPEEYSPPLVDEFN